jgi:hypothetical protein
MIFCSLVVVEILVPGRCNITSLDKVFSERLRTLKLRNLFGRSKSGDRTCARFVNQRNKST